MQETIFCRTCGLSDHNAIKLYEDIKKWLPHSSVYIQNTPLRIVVCRGAIATVISDGDVFSFVQRHNEATINDIINHSEKRDTVYISIENRHFLIETYVYKTIGHTDNMKFRLTCLTEPELSQDFDDYASLSNELNNYMWYTVSTRLMTL